MGNSVRFIWVIFPTGQSHQPPKYSLDFFPVERVQGMRPALPPVTPLLHPQMPVQSSSGVLHPEFARTPNNGIICGNNTGKLGNYAIIFEGQKNSKNAMLAPSYLFF